MENAMILIHSTTATAVAANGVVPLGNAVHGYGKGIRLNGNTVKLCGTGYYTVTVNITANVTGTEALTASIVDDGNAVVSASATPTAAGDNVNLTLVWVFRNSCCCDSPNFKVVLDSAATVTEIVTVVEKL